MVLLFVIPTDVASSVYDSRLLYKWGSVMSLIVTLLFPEWVLLHTSFQFHCIITGKLLVTNSWLLRIVTIVSVCCHTY